MQTLIQARWLLLVGALVCGAAFLLPVFYYQSQYWAFRPELLMLFVPPLLWGGTEGMRAHLSARGQSAKWTVRIGRAATIAWLVAIVVGALAQTMGPGGGVLGILVLLPAAALGLIGLFVALIGFAMAETRKGS